MNKYLLVLWHDIEPELFGPFDDEEARLKKAQSIRDDDGEGEHGLYRVNSETCPEIDTFANLEF